MHTLIRGQIVGKRLVHVWQSPWTTEEGISSCDLFAELEGGILFQLNGTDDNFSELPLNSLGAQDLKLIPAEMAADNDDYVGIVVKEVITNECIPFFSIGLLLLHFPRKS